MSKDREVLYNILLELSEDVDGYNYSSFIKILFSGPSVVRSRQISNCYTVTLSPSISGAIENGIVVDLSKQKSRKKTLKISNYFMEFASELYESISNLNSSAITLLKWPRYDGIDAAYITKMECEYLKLSFGVSEFLRKELMKCRLFYRETDFRATRERTVRSHLNKAYSPNQIRGEKFYLINDYGYKHLISLIESINQNAESWSIQGELNRITRSEQLRKIRENNRRKRDGVQRYLGGNIPIHIPERMYDKYSRIKKLEIFERLSSLGMSKDEIASVLNISKKEITETYRYKSNYTYDMSDLSEDFNFD